MGSIVLRESYHFFSLPFSPRSLFARRKRSSNCYSVQRFCVKLNQASKCWSYYMKEQLANRQKMSNVPYKRSVFLLFIFRARAGKCTLELTAKDQLSGTKVTPRPRIFRIIVGIFLSRAKILLALPSRVS